MRKKAQTATEYLIILAVVIIIALIVVGVMGGIPGIGGGAKGRASAAYWSTSDIAFTSYAVGTTGGTFNIRNNKVSTIQITAMQIGSVSSGWSLMPVTLTSGQTQQLTNNGTQCTSGDAFSYTVAITYLDTATGASYNFDGDGTLLEGTCAN